MLQLYRFVVVAVAVMLIVLLLSLLKVLLLVPCACTVLEAMFLSCLVELFIEVSVTHLLRACHFPLAILVIEWIHYNY